MLIETDRGPVFQRKGFPHGEINEGDEFEMPEGSCDRLINCDYDIENGEVQSRNGSVESDLLYGLNLPDGYSIIPKGTKMFSFNEPVDKEITLLFASNGVDIKIYINWLFNPPAPKTEEPDKTNDYENHIKSYAAGWHNEWTELTEYREFPNFSLADNYNALTENVGLSIKEDYYRGWFLWNKTKWNTGTTAQIRNESFACIESYDGQDPAKFTIQERDGLNFNDMGWEENDSVYLIRYPFIVHEAINAKSGNLGLDFDSIEIIPTATSVNCLTGKAGNLQLRFINKDTAKETGYILAYQISNVSYNPPKIGAWTEISGDYTGSGDDTYAVTLTDKPVTVTGWSELNKYVITFQFYGDHTRVTFDGTIQGAIFAPWGMNESLIPTKMELKGVTGTLFPSINETVFDILEYGHPSVNIWFVDIPYIFQSGSYNAGNCQSRYTIGGQWKWEYKKNGGASVIIVNGQIVLNHDYDIEDGIKIQFNSANFQIGNSITIYTEAVLIGTETLNEHKYYGFYLEYEQFPIIPTMVKVEDTATQDFYLNEKVGIKVTINQEAATGSKVTALALMAVLDGYQKTALFRGINKDLPLDMAYRISILNYHHYSRRISGYKRFGHEITNIITDDIKGFRDYNEGPSYSIEEGRMFYAPIYGFSANDTLKMEDPNNNLSFFDGKTLEAYIQYTIDEPIYNKSTFGIYTQGRMFEGGDPDDPDMMKYSLLRKENILPLQNQQPIDAVDRDKNVTMNLLGVNPVIFKNKSYHIISIENKQEVDWRSVDSRSRIGCNIPRSVVRTPYGLSFANTSGIWFLPITGDDPINLLSGRRQKRYLQVIGKENIFGEWYEKHSEIWYYMGNNTFWIFKLSPSEKKGGWKTYEFPFAVNDLTINGDGDLFLIGDTYLCKYLNDDEMREGTDATGESIVITFSENPQTLAERRSAFHVIENMLSIKYEENDGLLRNGHSQSIVVIVYGEGSEVMQTKVFNWNVGTEVLENLIWGNNEASRQSLLRFTVVVPLTYIKRLKITELNSLISKVPQMWKSGFLKGAVG